MSYNYYNYIFLHLLQFSHKTDYNVNVMAENVLLRSTSLGCYFYSG